MIIRVITLSKKQANKIFARFLVRSPIFNRTLCIHVLEEYNEVIKLTK